MEIIKSNLYYYTIEVEVTNYCDAQCVFCANSKLKRPRGYLSVDEFGGFICDQKRLLQVNFFRKKGVKDYPRVTFCGLGDPLKHPLIDELIKIASNAGFYTQLVTTGYMINESLAKKLCDSGLNEICFSLHSVNKSHYKMITGLNIENILSNLKKSVPILKDNDVIVNIWRIYHPQEKYRDNSEDEVLFLNAMRELDIEDKNILGPSEPWERDGTVAESKCDRVNDSPFWCNKILFTFNIDWQGNVVLCCNDYNRETMNLGNVFSDKCDYFQILETKKKILEKRIKPDICVKCRRWPDNEIYNILKEKDIKEIVDSIKEEQCNGQN